MALLNTNIGPERVQVFDVPLGTVQLPGVPTSITAFLISTTKVGAPENTPTAVTDLASFEDVFGGPDDVANEAYYAVQGFFDNAGTGNTAIIVHVGTSATANDYIGSASDGSGLRALDALDQLGLVTVPGLPLELAYLVHPALIDYTETVRAEFGATLSTSFSLLAMPEEIQKANASVAQTGLLPVASTGTLTLSIGSSPDLSGITPGMVVKKAGAFEAVITAVDDGTDTITVTTLGTITAGDDVVVHIPSAVEYKESVINNPSRVASWYFNQVLVTDRSSAATPGDVIGIDPIGHVAGIMARIDANTAIGGVSHAAAGIQFAGIAGILGLTLAISERVDAEPLRENFINRITSFPGSGNIIFGAYTADSGTSPVFTADEQLSQVMRSLQFIKGTLEPGLRLFIWENFSPATQGQVEAAILAFLRNNSYLFPAGLPENQQFQVVRIEPTQEELDLGLLRVRVLVRPNKAVRFIEISLEFPLQAS